MHLSKLVRTVGLALIVSTAAMASFAAPPAPQPCSCAYCSTVNPNKSCTLNGNTITCGTFLSFTTCAA
ncbi:MAG TPA: hypothetical protein VMW27_29015 [Thermoanaerobaculia bacterium]|nr:hypothetical protein [Thermoanaerobaculia bacterium]